MQKYFIHVQVFIIGHLCDGTTNFYLQCLSRTLKSVGNDNTVVI